MENALVIVDQPAPPAELAGTLELAADFARASKAKTTLAAYRSDWGIFECWCQGRGLAALAASPEVVCGFLADEATRGRRASTLGVGRRLAARLFSPGRPGFKCPAVTHHHVTMRHAAAPLGVAWALSRLAFSAAYTFRLRASRSLLRNCPTS